MRSSSDAVAGLGWWRETRFMLGDVPTLPLEGTLEATGLETVEAGEEGSVERRKLASSSEGEEVILASEIDGARGSIRGSARFSTGEFDGSVAQPDSPVEDVDTRRVDRGAIGRRLASSALSPASSSSSSLSGPTPFGTVSVAPRLPCRRNTAAGMLLASLARRDECGWRRSSFEWMLERRLAALTLTLSAPFRSVLDLRFVIVAEEPFLGATNSRYFCPRNVRGLARGTDEFLVPVDIVRTLLVLVERGFVGIVRTRCPAPAEIRVVARTGEGSGYWP